MLDNSQLTPHSCSNKTCSVTGIILTHNNERTIEIAVKSMIPLIQELIIVDDYSTDNTIKIIKSLYPRVKIYQRALNDHFAEQRNFALSNSTNEWVLMIDSDEEISQELSNHIKRVLQNPQSKAYSSYRSNAVFDKWTTSKLERPLLFHQTLRFEDSIHETIKQVKITYLKGKLNHYSWIGVEDHALDIIQYAKWQAQAWYHRNANYSTFYLVCRCMVSIPYIFSLVYIRDGKWRLGWLGILYALSFVSQYMLSPLFYYELKQNPK